MSSLLLLGLLSCLRYSLLSYGLEGKKTANTRRVLSNNKAIKSRTKRKYTRYNIKGHYRITYLTLGGQPKLPAIIDVK